jgi:hypothetical protein
MLFLTDATGIIPRPKREMPVRGVPEKVPHDKIKTDPVLDVALCVRRL